MWLLLGVLLGVLIGRGIRLADRKQAEAARDVTTAAPQLRRSIPAGPSRPHAGRSPIPRAARRRPPTAEDMRRPGEVRTGPDASLLGVEARPVALTCARTLGRSSSRRGSA